MKPLCRGEGGSRSVGENFSTRVAGTQGVLYHKLKGQKKREGKLLRFDAKGKSGE